MDGNILPADPYPQPHPLTLGLGSTGQTSTYSEHGHVTYQIKGNHQMQQHGSKYFAPQIPYPPPPLTWGWGQLTEIQLLQNMVMLHIK